MTPAARWLESAALVAACAVFAVTADERALALVLVAASFLPALTGRRLPLGPNVQLLFGALALGGAWWYATVLAEGPPRGSDELHPIVAGAALFGLLVAAPRAAMAAPWGGRRGTAGFALFAVIACGGAVHGAVYPALAALYGGIQLVALNALDPGRLSWAGLTRRARGALLAGLALTALVVAVIAVGLPPLHDFAVGRMRRAFRDARTGFGLHLQLGSLRGMIASDEVVLRVEGPAPPLLRGVVYDRYVDGRWATMGGAWPRPVPGVALAGADVTTIRTLGGDEERLFLPFGVAAVGDFETADVGRLRADAFGVFYPPDGQDADRVRFRTGAPPGKPVAPVAPPGAGDLLVPDDLRAPLDALNTAWGVDPAWPEQALRALAGRFQRDFRYSLSFERERGRDPVLDFLTRSREGHCEYFASAAALLLRAAGLPARVVGGYRVTERNPITGFHVVRESNAHAWVEVHVAGDWRTFDPTPSAPLSSHMAERTPWIPALLLAAGAWLDALVDELPQLTPTEWALFAIVPLLAIFVWSRWRNRERRRRRGASRILGTYADPLPALLALFDALAALGESRPASEPLEVFAERLRASPLLAADGPPVAAAVAAYAAWRYGEPNDPAPIAERLTALAAQLRGAPERATVAR